MIARRWLWAAWLASVVGVWGQSPQPARKAGLPLVVYDNCSGGELPFVPSGWMGNTDAIQMDLCSTNAPHSGPHCIAVVYTEAGLWGGVAWQDPPDDWGQRPGGWDLTGAQRLAFWARGGKGGEAVEFKVGLLERDVPYFDTAIVTLGKVVLTPEWQEYSIPLTGKDLSRIKTGFVWVLSGKDEPITFYLDDIRFE